MSSLIPMVLILAIGVAWPHIEPNGLTAQQLRNTLNALVVNLMAPALILYVMLTSPLQQELYQVPFTGIITISICLALSFVVFSVLIRLGYISRAQAGALIIAGSFGNGMGIAVPTVEALYGQEMTSIPLIYDLLSTVPFVWVIAVLIAAHFGTRVAGGHLGRELLFMPPVWAIVISLLILNMGWDAHPIIISSLEMLSAVTIPLLLIMVGLNFKINSFKYLLLTLPALFISLIISPAISLISGAPIGLSGDVLLATGLTSAAPPVIVGIALTERFKLDTALFCTALTFGTILFLIAAPFFPSFAALF